MSKKLDFAVQFAATAGQMGITPRQLAMLCELSSKRFAAEVKCCNEPDPQGRLRKRSDKIEKLLADTAHEMGFQVEYNGLAPTFVNAEGRNFHVPN